MRPKRGRWYLRPVRTPSRRDLLAALAATAAPAATGRAPGEPAANLSRRSSSVRLERSVDAIGQDAYTPLQELSGAITPSDLHFSRNHFGTPRLDAEGYELVVHGLVDRPTAFSLEDLKRMPSRCATYFLECAGNGAGAFHHPRPTMSPQYIDGATSNSEWVGVPAAFVLRQVGVASDASWMLAESHDAGRYARSIPLAKAYDDALFAYAQNGEPLRAEQGFPLRLVLPGWEGSASIKWLRRVELLSRPAMTRDETARYSDVALDGAIHPFTFVMGVKSIITTPSYPEVLLPGWREIRGLAWSGHGRIARVDVTTDGGATWRAAELDPPVLPKAHTRFRLAWSWSGEGATLMSRALDERGNAQPTLEEFRADRPAGNDYHNNYIRAWRVAADGRVAFASGC